MPPKTLFCSKTSRRSTRIHWARVGARLAILCASLTLEKEEEEVEEDDDDDDEEEEDSAPAREEEEE